MKNIFKMFKKAKSNTSTEEVLQMFSENKNTPAYPQNVHFKDCEIDFYGLTKREYFAGLAMQGMLSDPNASNFKPPFIAELAVDFSDALLKELDKK